MAKRVLSIDLDDTTDNELTTETEEEEEEEDTDMNHVFDINKGLTEETKKCFDGKKDVKCLPELSAHFKSIYFDEDFGDNRIRKLDVLKTLKDVEKSIKNDLKGNIFEITFDHLPSTSGTVDKKEIIGKSLEQTSDEYPLRSVKMKDQSTDTRYVYRPSDSGSKSEGLCSVTNDKSASDTTTLPTNQIWIYLCSNCGQPLDSKRDFYNHFDEIHAKSQNLIKSFLKIEKSKLQTPIVLPKNISIDTNTQSKKKRKKKKKHRFSSLTRSLELTRPSVRSKDKHKKRNKKTKSKTCPNVMRGELPSTSSVIYPNYRLYQRCKICSYTPLINSMEAIRDHIIIEHKTKEEDINTCFSAVLVQVGPRRN